MGVVSTTLQHPAVLGENVTTLPLGVAMPELHEAVFVVAVEEAQVDAMLAVEVPHGGVDASPDDGARGLVVSELLELHLVAAQQLQKIQHGNRFSAKSMIGCDELTLGGRVAHGRLLRRDSLQWEPCVWSHYDQQNASR